MKKLIAVTAALVLALGLACAALAEGTIIKALPTQIDINNLEDRFITTDIEYKGNGKVTLTLFDTEHFDAEALKAAKPGDSIESEGQTTVIESSEWDGPDLYFNRGTENEMLFCSYDDKIFQHVFHDEDDRETQVQIGTLEADIMPSMTMLDWVDEKTGESYEDKPAVRDGEELLKLLEKKEGPGFAQKNVRILYSYPNTPMLIWRFYSPAQ